jgi:hypothetical protein
MLHNAVHSAEVLDIIAAPAKILCRSEVMHDVADFAGHSSIDNAKSN